MLTKPTPEEKGWTYVDIMATALALSPSTEFDPSDDKWNAAWQEIAQRASGKRLLPEVTFNASLNYQGYSDEVETLRGILLRAHVITMPNPWYDPIMMNKQTKRAVQKRNSDIIEAYRPELEEMAEVLTTRLALVSDDDSQ